jgi:hypothetical protein
MQLTKSNRFQLILVPADEGITGNEMTDQLPNCDMNGRS